MNAIVYILLIINLILKLEEYSIMKDQNMNRIVAVKKLTSICKGQIIVALANVILCIICVTRLIRAFKLSANDYSNGALITDMFIGFISVVIILRHSTPKNAIIKQYLEIWYRERLKKAEQLKQEGHVTELFVLKKPTLEEFMNPKWPPRPEQHETIAATQEVLGKQSIDSDDSLLPDEDDLESEEYDETESLTLYEKLLELLEENDRIGALKLYMDETGDTLPEALEYIEEMLLNHDELEELEYGDSRFDEQVKYNVLLKTVNDGPVSAAHYYSEVYDVDFIEAYEQVREINEEFGND